MIPGSYTKRLLRVMIVILDEKANFFEIVLSYV